MNEEVLADLKQFIAATVSQSTAELMTKVDHAASEARVLAELKLIQAAIADTLSTSNDANDARPDDHESRLNRLEQRAA